MVTADGAALSLSLTRAMLSRFPLIDGHNDLPWVIREKFALDPVAAGLTGRVEGTHTDIPRLVEGGVGGQFWSVYVPASLAGDAAVTAVFEQVDLVHRMIAAYPTRFQLAVRADDVDAAFAAGKIASLLGAEGGHCINSSLGVLRSLYALGVRYMTLTHNDNVGWADSATDQPDCGGLSEFGRDVVTEMQRLGMLVDLSHVAVTTMNDALDIARAPVIFSHSSARALTDNPRNVPDDVLTRLAVNGGVCMVAFVPFFVSQECTDWFTGLKAFAAGPRPRPGQPGAGLRPAPRMGEGQPHARRDRVPGGRPHRPRPRGGGRRATSASAPTSTAPRSCRTGLHDVCRYPALFHELQRRHWSEADLKALAGANILRALRDAESCASAQG